ncbi:hypothetical protein C2G38_2026846 [Gigaspora rosea]|uniref:Uncharacterized protein n=1 Tax=Gigaspora rosea TaxID=44941 RepID=A0A397WDF8_9GLOM|nr:hypothetical protein C2G38_2026846 [Gigaspora rosea]
MADNRLCEECQATKSLRFRRVVEGKWKEVVANDLKRSTWEEGVMLCNTCYMHFVKNPLCKASKWVKTTHEQINVTTDYIDLTNETTSTAEEVNLYLAARPTERIEQTMDHMKKIIVFTCYLLASLNNTKINAFKFDLEYYLDSSGTSNEGLNTMANLGVTTTSRAIDRKKKKMSDEHGEYVEKALRQHSENFFILNVDDYHNIHVLRQPETTSTLRPTHMATILANPFPAPAILCDKIINPNIVDSELINVHLGSQFIVNLGVSYHDCMRSYRSEECSDEELINRLVIHSYNDRLNEKKKDRHIRDSILFDFVEGNLKGIEGYISALQVVYNQVPMQEYLSNYVVPVVADWPGQFFIRKALAQRLLTCNEDISQFITSFVPIIGPLHISLNARELVFLKNSKLFNDIYKDIFGARKKLGNKPRPWRVDLILHIVRMAWLDIVDTVYLKFSRICKNIEFLYLTDLFSNLIPLVLDIYAEELQTCTFDVFSDIFYWMDIGHPIIINIITNNLAGLSDRPVEIAHSIIRRNTAKFFDSQQLCYEITDRHLPRGFVTLKKPNVSILCDFTSCDRTNDLLNGTVLGMQAWCFICLDYLQGEVEKNVKALIKSLTSSKKEKIETESIYKNNEDEENSDDTEEVTEAVAIENQLERAKKLFLEL